MTDHNSEPITYTGAPTRGEIKAVQEGLMRFNTDRTNGDFRRPGIEINLVARNRESRVVGGISASTVLKAIYLEVLWVAEEVREHGLGSRLVLQAEQIGLRAGCLASHTYTFNWQAPGFYRKLGYRLLGIYDGYPGGITEHVLMKRLPQLSSAEPPSRRSQEFSDVDAFAISEPASDEEMQVVHTGLGRYVYQQIGDKRNDPGIDIRLVAKNSRGQVVGGLLGGTTIRTMFLDHLWVHEQYRGQGVGAQLTRKADRIAKESGCIACQTFCYSFHSPEFFWRQGYETYGVSDGYPEGIREYYLIKRYEQ